MTGLMKTVSILCNPMTHIHVNFTTPKGLKIEGNKKNTKEHEREDQRGEREKKSSLERNAWAERQFFNTVFINPDVYMIVTVAL